MARNNSNLLYPLDLKIKRTYIRLRRGIKENHIILGTTSSNSEIEYIETEEMTLTKEFFFNGLAIYC